MKRFITYVYEYKEGQKMKNVGFIRVDIRGKALQMMINIKLQASENENGEFVLYIKDRTMNIISLDDFVLFRGEYNKKIFVDLEDEKIALENVLGAAFRFEGGRYLASCWKDGEEKIVAQGNFLEEKEIAKVDVVEETVVEQEDKVIDLQVANVDEALRYCKINLSEIHGLPNRYWHFSNNSFLIHGFWNYGYLVLKETMEDTKKRTSLGVPGVFEQPEMVMASYFGFSSFEKLPIQVEEMEIGACCMDNGENKNQQIEDGTFGCWFADL